jgi:dTDP-4-amino-4,6-dideoxygalactose transaminase
MNARLDAIQAGVVTVKLDYIDSWAKSRKEKAQIYFNLFKKFNLTEKIIVPFIAEYTTKHVFNQFVIRLHKRDELKKFLADNGIGSSIFYPLCLHLQECFDNLGYKQGDFIEAENASQEVLALPIYPELTYEEQEYIVIKINEFFK